MKDKNQLPSSRDMNEYVKVPLEDLTPNEGEVTEKVENIWLQYATTTSGNKTYILSKNLFFCILQINPAPQITLFNKNKTF